MIETRLELTGSIDTNLELAGELNEAVRYIEPITQEKTVTPTKETQTITPDVDFTGLNKVTVNPIPDNYIEPEGSLAITTNGDVDVTMFRMARVGVYAPPTLQDKEVTPTKETQTVAADEGYDGLNNVTVNAIPNEYIIPSGTLDINENGKKDVTGYAEVNVNVNDAPNLQDKSITVTENGTQNIVADEGYSGLNSVVITTEVAGGETTSKRLDQQYIDIMNDIKTNFTPSYNKTFDTNEEVILYSPAENYTVYAIFQTTGGKFYIKWFTDNIKILHQYNVNEVRNYGSLTPKSSPNLLSDTPITKISELLQFSSTYVVVYYTPNYDTIDECINALKDSTTTYKKNTTSSYNTTYVQQYEDTTIAVVLCNCRTIGYDGRLGACTRQISSNETIEVIPTE